MSEETVRTRADLVSLLTTAAEIEHSLMVQYLFAALTMKQSTDEGLSEHQLIRVAHWEKQMKWVTAGSGDEPIGVYEPDV